MAANEIHLNDIGTVFRVTLKDGDVAVDLTGATVTNFIFLKSGGVKITRAAMIPSGQALNGILEYTTVSGDLDTLGIWELQVQLVIPSWNGRSDIGKFTVHANL